MMPTPLYQPSFERLLDFAASPRFEAELQRARTEFFTCTGEVFDEDRSFDVRMQAFLDWFVFDRPLDAFGEPPTRALALDQPLDPVEALRFRILGRTVHGLFRVRRVKDDRVGVANLVTDAEYDVAIPKPLAGVAKDDLFEGRLVPFEGALHFSNAFLFHPRSIRRRLVKEIRRRRRHDPLASVQDLVWTLARMASRAEHYRNVSTDAIYDFSRPPPIVAAAPMRFDRASVEARLGRTANVPAALPRG